MFATKMNGNDIKRRIYLQTINYYSEDALFLSMNLKSSLSFASASEEPMDVDFDDDYTVPKTDTSVPNDIDLINQSLENYLETNVYNYNQDNELLLKNENSKCVVKREPPKIYSKSFPTVLLVLFAVVFYYFMSYSSEINNSNMLQNIAEELEARVLFQDEAIQLLLKNLQCANTSEECRRLLPFVGSTGVGKTLIGNILKKHFPEKYVNEINSVKLNKMPEAEDIKTANGLVCNLVIMDDLKFEHVNSMLSFANTLPNVRCLFIIPIFNIQETRNNIAHTIRYDNFEVISHKCRESRFKCEVILFNVINENVVEKWMKELLVSRNFDKKHFSVIKDVLEQQDIKHYGFKGIEAKLNLFLYQYSKR